MARIVISNIAIFSCLLGLAFPVFGVDKFCRTTGVFYCALGSGAPDISQYCFSTPEPAIMPGINTPAKAPFNGGVDWSYQPWHVFSLNAPTSKQRFKGVSQVIHYTEAWHNPRARPKVVYNSAEVLVYNCKLCPSGTTLAGGDCVVNPAKDSANNGYSCKNSTDHPINISTGNKHYHEEDYIDKDFSVVRSYNSLAERWEFNYRQKLYLYSLVDQPLQLGNDGNLYYPHDVSALRQDGKTARFVYQGAAGHRYTPRLASDQLTLRLVNPEYNTVLAQGKGDIYLRDANGLLVIERNTAVAPTDLGATHELSIGSTFERYDIRGNLTQIKEPGAEPYDISHLGSTTTVSKGARQIKIVSDIMGRVSEISLPDQSVISYRYESNKAQKDKLLEVYRTFPGGDVSVMRKYLYEDSAFPSYITGVEDEKGNRISSVKYDVQGRAIRSEYGSPDSGIGLSLISYKNNGTRVVTNALGKNATYHFSQYFGEYKVTKIDGHPSSNCVGGSRAFTYDPAGRLVSSTDWKGVTTTYSYNDQGLETSRIEAAGTAQARTITTEWHPTLFLPLAVTEPSRITTYTYDAQGRQLSQSVTQR